MATNARAEDVRFKAGDGVFVKIYSYPSDEHVRMSIAGFDRGSSSSFELRRRHLDALEDLQDGAVVVLRQPSHSDRIEVTRTGDEVTLQGSKGPVAKVSPAVLSEIVEAARREKIILVLRNTGPVYMLGFCFLWAAYSRMSLFGARKPWERHKQPRTAGTFERVLAVIAGVLVWVLAVFYSVVKIFELHP